jgi:hypothetical protein
VIVNSSLGFNPFRAIVHAHVVGTRAIAKAIQNPRVQQAAIAAGQAYGGRAGSYANYAQQFTQPQPGQMPPGPPATGDEVANDDGTATMAPVKKGNLLPLALIGGAALVVLFMLKK